ncbi:uncharacterized protein LOC113371242 [Ctenocephalides felis]|uniref:uncharacterized protein LOC113371242 n=1 Tax=Ctenocephalides felis TaxID=7515 RepID=UPI000E6E51E1|nr:uncharacterized protein LOC113371242 [Ctenocephalides felis]
MGAQSCKPLGKSKLNAPIGYVLDHVISQADKASSQCMLYKIVNYKKGGELIDAYNFGGQSEVEKLIKGQFGVLMYCNGHGQKINRAEYLRWKYRDHNQVAVPIESSLSPHDPLSKWQDHKACWQMRYRGLLGESMLHVLIICDTRLHTKLARTLLRCFPNLALDVVEGEEYLGASALHLAIAYSNNELVQDLLEAGANVNQRAIGSFFLPRDQQQIRRCKYTDYEGLAYLGEYPLAWAACCANESVYNMLLDNGADPDLCDTFGNTVLHMVVVCDKLDMFGYALRHPKLPAKNGMLNYAGLTPLTLACTLGRAEVFREMLELSAKEFWRYSNITCSAYPLNALDTLLPDGRTNMGAQSCKPLGKSKLNAPIGYVLDHVISQADKASSQCMLYKIVNYKKGGELIDAYNFGGQSEVEKLIKGQFGVLMYCNGHGQKINRAEYLRWKYRDHNQVAVPIESSLSPHDPLSKWQDHKACWQMRYRGLLGESMLHVLIICDTRLHTKLARTLLRCFPNLALDVVEGEEYLGASALHLAIAYSNNELVQDLLEAGANVNQRAIGSFFLPRDQQQIRRCKYTDYEGLAYLGEYPLAWAACCANESVYNMLLDNGADPDLCDTFGNTVLHMVVVCDKLDMFGYALRHPKLPAKNGMLNYAGLTPLTLACTLGRAEVFREMLELSAKEFWRYSNITCSAYPLNALDTLLPDGRTNWNSALFIILNGTKEAHLDMLDGGIIQKLLEEKWKTFARKQFLKRLLILFIHLICLSMAVYLRPTDNNFYYENTLDSPYKYDDTGDSDIKTLLRYVFEVATIMGVLSYVILQQGDEVKNQGMAAFLKQLTHAPAKAIFLISNFLILCCIPCRLMGDRKTEEAILVFAVPGSWFLLMFFAGAVRLTGPFVTMIYSMITGDMLTFGIIYMIVLFGFSQSFYFLYKGFPSVKSTLYGNYPRTWMALFQITLGDYVYSDLGYTTYPNLSKTVFVIFMVFVPILLLNMLIAMMGNTYAHVIEQSEKEWMKQWAKIVVTLERAVSQTDLHKYLEEYSIGMGPSDDSSYEQRGVMIIKSKSKTRAKQRKGALTNWKRVGRVTINELHKRNISGEDLRKLMWGRLSISTPTKEPKMKYLL